MFYGKNVISASFHSPIFSLLYLLLLFLSSIASFLVIMIFSMVCLQYLLLDPIPSSCFSVFFSSLHIFPSKLFYMKFSSSQTKIFCLYNLIYGVTVLLSHTTKKTKSCLSALDSIDFDVILYLRNYLV